MQNVIFFLKDVNPFKTLLVEAWDSHKINHLFYLIYWVKKTMMIQVAAILNNPTKLDCFANNSNFIVYLNHDELHGMNKM